MDREWNVTRGAVRRWQDRSTAREKIQKGLKDRGVAAVESPERIQKRLDRLTAAINQEKAVSAAMSEPGAMLGVSRTQLLIEKVGLERVMGKADFLNTNFLELALAVSRFVGRISIRNSPTSVVGFGTGFMISPRLLMTNNHVLGNPAEAMHSEVEFDYQYDRFGRLLQVVTYGLEPQTFFITDQKLDYTVVAVRESSLNNVELKQYGWNRLIEEQGKAILGDPLNIIQHPKGEAKQIVLRSNQLIDLFDTFAHYLTDTEPGSSGSPVYNDQWEIVALHHSGVPKMKNGDYIAKDGSVWVEGMDPDDLDWVANEGIRISSVVDHIKKQPLSPPQSKLRNDMLTLIPPHPFEAAEMAARGRDRKGSPVVAPSPSGQITPGEGAEEGVFTWTIPLQVSVRLGIPTVSSQPSPVSTIISSDTDAPDVNRQADDTQPDAQPTSPLLREALAELDAAADKKYYDEQRDGNDRDRYYRDVSVDADPEDVYRQLSNLLGETHRNKLKYQPALHVYPWVDLHDGQPKPKLKSIYSGRDADPRAFIEGDFRIEQERLRLQEMFVRESTLGNITMEQQLEFLEASLPYNCEHVVPQSWFGKREPMRGDLHHLFACESGCNSFRSNIPYYDFPDFEEAIREACGKREENKFEPSFGKGPVARATLYFLLRYPNEINRTQKEYTEDRIKILLRWHEKEDVTDYERHRNMAIYEKQGNRNPLIDHPDWADRIDFIQGLG